MAVAPQEPQIPLSSKVSGFLVYVLWVAFLAALAFLFWGGLPFDDSAPWLKLWETIKQQSVPRAENKGWGGLSFISVCTGLNLALVKLESYIKSLESVKAAWVKKVEERLDAEATDGALADDTMTEEATAILFQSCTDIIERINEENSAGWIGCRKLAIHCTVVGFIFLFFQYSAGLISLLLAYPVIGTYVSWSNANKKLFATINGNLGFVGSVQRMLKQNFKKKVGRATKERQKAILEVVKPATTASRQPKPAEQRRSRNR